MAVCESQLESGLARIKREDSDETSQERTLPAGLPLTVDYRSPVSHFVPPAVELYAARHKQEPLSSAESTETSTPVKRKRGRPRVDKTSPEYLANLAARKQAREMAAMSRGAAPPPDGKRKRGRPRVDKTSPEYIARKRARELEALERKAKREYKRRSTAAIAKTKTTVTKPITGIKQQFTNKQANKQATKKPQQRPKLPPMKNKVPVRKLPQKSGKVATVRMVNKKIVMRRNKFAKVKRKDSGASSSTGDTTPRVKRKYTKRTPNPKKDGTGQTERVKGKRGRPRKDQMNPNRNQQAPKIRVRSNLMPVNNEPISLDSDDEPDLGSPGAASDSLSLDENLRALRHIHEKYANIDKDDLYEAHLLAANFKKPQDGSRMDDDVLSVRSSEGGASVNDMDRVEKLEDSSNSDSDSSSSSGSSSSGSSSSSSSGSSDSSDSSDSDSDDELKPKHHNDNNIYPTTPWPPQPPDSDSDPEKAAAPEPVLSHDEISESDNESPDKSFQCHICSKWYSTRVTLKIHRRSHQNRGGGGSRSRARSTDRYPCDICTLAFTRRDKLYAHKAEAHRGSMTFRCEVCLRCFEHDDELASHVALHTDDERNGRCTECNTSFPSFSQLTAHRAAAHAQPVANVDQSGAHACAHCGKRFTHVHSLTRHLHNHAKQLYRCVVCKASFARADQLAQHLNSHLANYKRLKP